jgi:uncharacterized protein (UPF0305 family)
MNLPEILAGEIDSQVFGLLKNIDKKGALGQALALEAQKYSIVDLQRISAGLARSITNLPSPYKEKITPYFIEQYFRRYYRLIGMNDSGSFKDLKDEIKEKKLYIDYCNAIEMSLRDWEAHRSVYEYDPQYQLVQYGLFYFIINCFAMFVLEEPGHPVGMPFPGGFKVEKRDGLYYCPIREKEKDLPYSICNFCPCKQADI